MSVIHTGSWQATLGAADKAAQDQGRTGISELEKMGLAQDGERYSGTAGLGAAEQRQLHDAGQAIRHWALSRLNTAETMTGGGSMSRISRAVEPTAIDDKLAEAGQKWSATPRATPAVADFDRMYFSSTPQGSAEKADLAAALKAVGTLPDFPRHVLTSHMLEFADRFSWVHLHG